MIDPGTVIDEIIFRSYDGDVVRIAPIKVISREGNRSRKHTVGKV